jgi:chromosome segregation ATPase
MSGEWRLPDDDPLQRWRDDAEQREAAKARRRHAEARERRRQEEQTAVDQLRAEMLAEIAAVRNELEVFKEAVGEALGEHCAQVIDHDEKMIRETQNELHQKFGELRGHLDALLAGTSPRSTPTKEFKFASEGDVVSDPVPPLVRKTTTMN